MAEEWIKKEKMAMGKLRKRERKGVHFEFNLNQFPQKPPFAFQKTKQVDQVKMCNFHALFGLCTHDLHK